MNQSTEHPDAVDPPGDRAHERDGASWPARLFKSQFFWFLLITFVVGLGLLHPPFVEALPGGGAVNHVVDAVLGHELRHKLGDAFIIAALLSILLDRYLKHELLREATKDVLSFAAGHGVPPKLKRVITAILRQPCVREDFQITLNLEPLATPGFVRLVLKTEYVVRNLTGDSQRYHFQSAIEKSYAPCEASALRRVQVRANGRMLIDKAQADLPQTPGVDGYLRFVHDVEVDAAGSLSVLTERSAAYADSYFYVLDVLDFTQGITVRAVSTADFDWNVVFGAAGPVTHKGTTWEHPGAHLPGQYVRILWTRKHPERK